MGGGGEGNLRVELWLGQWSGNPVPWWGHCCFSGCPKASHHKPQGQAEMSGEQTQVAASASWFLSPEKAVLLPRRGWATSPLALSTEQQGSRSGCDGGRAVATSFQSTADLPPWYFFLLWLPLCLPSLKYSFDLFCIIVQNCARWLTSSGNEAN